MNLDSFENEGQDSKLDVSTSSLAKKQTHGISFGIEEGGQVVISIDDADDTI